MSRRTREFEEQGRDPVSARRAAEAAFGHVERHERVAEPAPARGFAGRAGHECAADRGRLLGVSALGVWIPARRAGRVDPVVSLRAE